MSSVHLLQFTDPHLYGDERAELRGVATYPALQRALAQARERDWRAEALLVTGDLVQDDPAGYALFRRAFGGLGKPVLCIPGNHDEPQQLARALAGPPFQVGGHADFGDWRIVMLDSVVPGAAGGRLSATELAVLDAALGSSEGRHALVCLHHHPIAMASRWLDQVGLANAEEFFGVIERHRNVRAVLWGHVHQAFDGLRKGVRLLATPSTCAQFLPGSDDFAIDARPPAYRVLELREDGKLTTEVVWVETSAAGSRRSAFSAA